MPQDASGDNVLLGRGKVFFKRSDETDPAYRFMGNCTRVEAETTDELREIFSSASQDTPLLKSVNIRRLQAIVVDFSEYTKENLALALMGDTSVLAQGSGSVTNEAHANVRQDHFYKTAFRKISSLVVTGPSGTPTYTVTTDYILEDATAGLVYIVPGGTIADASDLEMDYSYAADTSATVRSGVTNAIEGAMLFIPDPATGPLIELEVWNVSISPEGAIGFISDDYASSSLRCKVLADAVNHPTEPQFRATYR